MTQIIKYKGSYTIPIHKHTPKRFRFSGHTIRFVTNGYTDSRLDIALCREKPVATPIVTFPAKGLEDPLRFYGEIYDMSKAKKLSLSEELKHQKVDWNEWLEDGGRIPEIMPQLGNPRPKPSLLKRLLRLGRSDEDRV